MAVSLLFDNVMESFTTTGTGTVTLAGAETGSQSFAVVGNLNTTVTTAWAVDANDNPSGAWEVAIGCTYTVSGTTMGRGTLLGSSTGSVISWAAGKKRIAQGIPALLFNYMFLGTKGVIQGLIPQYNSASVLRFLAGTCSINNKVLSIAQTDYTSGSTMKDLDESTVTLAANKGYGVFVKDLSGTLVGRVQNMNGSGSGNMPDFSYPYDYWESVNGPAERYIGPMWTDGSANIIPFNYEVLGRIRKYVLEAAVAKLVVSSVQAASPTAVTLVPYILNIPTSYDVLDFSNDGDTTTIHDHTLYIDGGTNLFDRRFMPEQFPGYLIQPRYNVLNTGTLHYTAPSPGSKMTLYFAGTTQYI